MTFGGNKYNLAGVLNSTFLVVSPPTIVNSRQFFFLGGKNEF
tara:strand:+ start:848 stop:973 length:126 start_codon:yes stop_codon:yes gene_type:complete